MIIYWNKAATNYLGALAWNDNALITYYRTGAAAYIVPDRQGPEVVKDRPGKFKVPDRITSVDPRV